MRDLGLVKGGKGMRHHEVVLPLSLRELMRRLRQPSAKGPETAASADLLQEINS